MNNLTKDFPYSKEEFKGICITVEFMILEACDNIASRCNQDQLEQIRNAYYNLKYILFLVWDYYELGDAKTVAGLREVSPMADMGELYGYTMFKAVFNNDPVGNLANILNEIEQENPFDYCGKIEGSDNVNAKLIKIYKHLLANIQSGNLQINRL